MKIEARKGNPTPTGSSGILLKSILCLLFVLGIVMCVAGVNGMTTFGASGYDSENAYAAIRNLGSAADANATGDLLPMVSQLPADQQTAFYGTVETLLADAWGMTPDELNAYLEANGVTTNEEKLRLLAMTYAVDGPKVKSSMKKSLAGVTDMPALRMQMLGVLCTGAAANEDEILSQYAAFEDADAALVMQLFFVTANADFEPMNADAVNTYKKAIRKDDLRIGGYVKAMHGDVSGLMALVVEQSRTIILLGVLLFVDIALLFFLLRAERSWKMDFKWIVILLIVDFLLVYQILPLIYLIVKAFVPDGTFSLETFTRLYSYSMNWSALTNTLIAALATMVLGTVLAFPLAWLVGRTNLYGRKFFRSLFVLTYMVPPYVGAMAWLRLLNPNVGTINVVLRAIFGLTAETGPLNIYSLGGLIWVLTTFYYPYAFITISRAMEKMDPSLEEASRISGASPVKTVLRVTLPMMTPSLIAGALLVFVSAASCYGIPSIIGAPGKVHTVTTRIIEYYGLGTQGINDATGLAVFLMGIAVIVLYVSDFVVAKKQYITVSGKSMRPNIVDLRKWRMPLTVMVSLFACIVVLIPFATILTTSFKVDVGKSLFDPSNFTFNQWITIFGREETLDCLKNSLLFGGATATIGILVACTMSYLLQRTRIRGRKIPDFLITLGSGTPSVVIALGLIMTMKGDFGVNIYNTMYIMVVAYLIKYLMMGMRTVTSAMSQIHVSLEESSQISGASWTRTMLRITGPLIFPSIAAGWFLIFIPSFYELSMTTLLYSNSTKTIGFQLYEYWTYTSQPQSCAMAFGILLFVVLLNYVLNRLTKGEFSI